MDEIKELKAAAYDCLAIIQNAQARLAKINERIAELQTQNPAVPASEASSDG